MDGTGLAEVCSLRPTNEIADNIDSVPEGPGVYLVFGGMDELLASAECEPDDYLGAFQLRGHDLLYIGSSLNLRARLLNHLKGDSRCSSLRASLGCLLKERLGLEITTYRKKSYFSFGEGEARLSDWIREHTSVALWPCRDPEELERALIRALPSPLNIVDGRDRRYARFLLAIRSRARRIPDASIGADELVGDSQ